MPRLFVVQLKDGPAERYEQWVNTPVYTHDYEDCIGWLGCELPEDGHSCEFAELAGDGAVACASSVKVNRLRDENAKLRELATEAIRLMQANGPDCGLCKHYSECWTGEAMDYSPSGCIICNDARELGIEVEE